MDVAALSLRIDSSDIVRATADLDKFSTASAKAGGATKSGSIARMAQEYGRAAEKASQYTNAASRAVAANDNVERATRIAITAQGNLAAATAKAGAAFGAADAHVAAYRNHLASLPQAASAASAGIDRVNRSVATSASAMKANTGNIAAQFQDIGVTAAMGMNPMLIALQQGTQLSAVFAASGGSAFKALGAAMLSVISPASLLTIGIVGLAAAGLQMIDWAKLGKSALDGLATAMVAVAPYAAGLGAVMALAFAPQILAAIVSVAVAIGTTLYAAVVKATAAMAAFAIANPFAAVVLGAAAAGAAVALVGKAFGQDFVTPIKEGINFVVGSFVGAFDAVQKTWRMLPAAVADAAIQAANIVIRTVDSMVNGVIERINGLTSKLPFGLGQGIQIDWRTKSGQLDNPYAGQRAAVGAIAKESIAAARGVDYVGKAISGVNSLAESGAAKLREWAKALGADGKKKGGDDAASRAADAVKPDKWEDLLAGADKQQRALDQAGAQIGVYGQALATLKREQDLFNQAQDQGIKLTAKMADELRSRAATMGAKDYENIRKAAAVYGGKAHAESMRQLEVERGAISLTGEALVAYQYKQEAINRALVAGVAMKDIDIGKLDEQARSYANAATANDAVRKSIEDQRAALEANRQAATAFFTDWIGGIRQGESVFKAFGNAVARALDNIIQKLIEAAIKQLFFNSLASAGGGGGIGGVAGGIINLLGGLFANGGAFGTAQKFANGGAFTDTVVNTPTLFRFAKGSKFGVMGEEGPEAVMPLSRDSSGRLGVKATAGAGSKPSEINIKNEYHLAGAIMPETIVAMIRQGNQMTEQSIRNNLPRYLQEWDADGAPSQG